MTGSVKEPAFKLMYQGRDITSALQTWPLEITYTDKKHGESDECQVKVHNSTGQWLDAWAPKKGDTFTLDYGYTGNTVPAGEFTVDGTSAEGDSSGDTVTFKGLATPKTKELRSKEHQPYENQSLKEIVQKIGGKHGFTVQGDVNDIKFDRITQNGERDLQFLKRLADDYGHYFTIKGKKLIFTDRNKLRAREPVRTIDRIAEFGQTLKSYNLQDADDKAASGAEVNYTHPQRKKLVTGKASAEGDLGEVTSSGDIVKATVRVDNQEQAERIAKSRLDNQNADKVSGDLTLVGDPLLCAGQVIGLKNFGRYDGKYLIGQSTHTMQRSGGYETKIAIERASDKQRQDGGAKSSKSGGGGDGGAGYLGEVKGDGSVTGGKS